MPRQRNKPIHPFIQRLMQSSGASTLKDYADMTGIPYTTLLKYADSDGNRADKATLCSLLNNAEKAGVTVDEFIRGLLAVG